MSSVTIAGSWTLEQSVSPDLWQTFSSANVPDYVSAGEATGIQARSLRQDESIPEQNLPFLQRRFDEPLVLRQQPQSNTNGDIPAIDFQELRLWFRSSREGDGRTEDKGFYVTFEIANDNDEESQQWFIPVKQQNTWELHSFWLGDISDSLLQAVRFFRVRNLDANRGFRALLGDAIATTPEPIQDADEQLLLRLNDRFEVDITNADTAPVPAFIDLPENPGDRTPPYILITPWWVQLDREKGSSGELIDNYRRRVELSDGSPIDIFEVARRPALKQLSVQYAIDVFAEDRRQKARLLDAILTDFSRQFYLVINGEPLTLSSFTPSPEQVSEFASPGRTPLYFQLTVPIEAGQRQFTTLAERPRLRFEHMLEQEPIVTDPETVLI